MLHTPRVGHSPAMAPMRIHVERDGSFMQFLPAFILGHYLVYTFPVVGSLWLVWRLELVPAPLFIGAVGAYVLSLFLRTPHKGRGWWWARGLVESKFWDGIHGYLDVTHVREAPLRPGKQVIFAIAPHGILSVVRALFTGSIFPRLFPGIYGRWVAATPQFLVPFGCRETMLLFQAIDASKPVLAKAIERGESLLLLPGGEQRACVCRSTRGARDPPAQPRFPVPLSLTLLLIPASSPHPLPSTGTKELMMTDPDSTVTKFACRDRLG